MPLFIGTAIRFAAAFIASIFNNFVSLWLRMVESRRRGEAEAKNVAHEENAKRKARSDEIMAKPVKTGDELIDGIRDRSDSDGS